MPVIIVSVAVKHLRGDLGSLRVLRGLVHVAQNGLGRGSSSCCCWVTPGPGIEKDRVFQFGWNNSFVKIFEAITIELKGKELLRKRTVDWLNSFVYNALISLLAPQMVWLWFLFFLPLYRLSYSIHRDTGWIWLRMKKQKEPRVGQKKTLKTQMTITLPLNSLTEPVGGTQKSHQQCLGKVFIYSTVKIRSSANAH